MSKERLEKLFAFIHEQPEDLFLKYALAMEYLGMNDLQQAEHYFKEVTGKDPQHVPAYYQLGKLYEQKGEEKMAIEAYEHGMEAAIIKKDTRAINEIRAALDELLL